MFLPVSKNFRSRWPNKHFSGTKYFYVFISHHPYHIWYVSILYLPKKQKSTKVIRIYKTDISGPDTIFFIFNKFSPFKTQFTVVVIYKTNLHFVKCKYSRRPRCNYSGKSELTIYWDFTDSLMISTRSRLHLWSEHEKSLKVYIFLQNEPKDKQIISDSPVRILIESLRLSLRDYHKTNISIIKKQTPIVNTPYQVLEVHPY